MDTPAANWFCIHPQSHVQEVQNHRVLNCGTCESPIAGKKYNCGACNSDLHPFCKSCPQTLSCALHPHTLTRLNRDVFNLLRRKCTVCNEEIKGVCYTCSPCNFDVHPQCSQLPPRVPNGCERNHTLQLQVGEFLRAGCHVCGVQCGNWAYTCHVCSVNVHFWCLVALKSQGADVTTTTTSRALHPRHRGNHQAHHHRHGQQHHHHASGHHHQRHHGMQPGFQNQHHHAASHHLHPGMQPGFQNQHHQWGGNGFIPNHNHNNNNNNNHAGGGIGGIMGRITGSIAVSWLCDLISNLIAEGLFFC